MFFLGKEAPFKERCQTPSLAIRDWATFHIKQTGPHQAQNRLGQGAEFELNEGTFISSHRDAKLCQMMRSVYYV